MPAIDRTPPPPGSPSAELIQACVEGNLVVVLQALRDGANPNAWRENEGPAIHSALAWPRIVEALIEAGAEPHPRSYWSERPLEKLAADYQASEDQAERRRMKQTARILKIKPRTVAFHKYGMMKQLGVKSTAELVQAAIRMGVVSA